MHLDFFRKGYINIVSFEDTPIMRFELCNFYGVISRVQRCFRGWDQVFLF